MYLSSPVYLSKIESCNLLTFVTYMNFYAISKVFTNDRFSLFISAFKQNFMFCKIKQTNKKVLSKKINKQENKLYKFIHVFTLINNLH